MTNFRKSYVAEIMTILAILITALSIQTFAQQTDINGPSGSFRFGQVTTLPNGNIVVIDSDYINPGVGGSAGAVYLYNGATGVLISTLKGSSPNNRIGSGGITVLANGNYLIRSPEWDSSPNNNAGAVTLGNKTTGVSGVVSSSNSLVGSSFNDQIGKDGFAYDGIVALSNGNYIVVSADWDNSAIQNAGAVTFGNGTTGTSGVVSSSNSLVGSIANDQVGSFGAVALINGNYVVSSPFWDNGALNQAGAVTFGNGTTGVSGVITSSNSLVGNATSDQIGNPGVTALTNGNYVVRSGAWNSASGHGGAVTFANGTTGITGFVTSANSLTGSASGGGLGGGTNLTVTPLTNGNYVVVAQLNTFAGGSSVGAVTFGNGTTGVSGEVSASNSLVGGTVADLVGSGGITALTNGNYVVSSPSWTNTNIQPNSGIDAGAVTFCDGTNGTTGGINSSNSLVGSTAQQEIGSAGVTALTNGNYVINSPKAFANSGAATWGNGTTGITGTISAANSLAGTGGVNISNVASGGTIALSNGNYVVVSPLWDNSTSQDVGAVTWGNGAMGTIGVVSASNSLVGSITDDRIGFNGVVALSNGNYVVSSKWWHNGTVEDAGAVTWGNGSTGTTGAVSPSNSLVGSRTNDFVGELGAKAFPDGTYAVHSRFWNTATVTDAGAVSYLNGVTGDVGPITSDNSVIGTITGEGNSMNFSGDSTNHQLVVGRPSANKVVLFRRFAGLDQPILFSTNRDGNPEIYKMSADGQNQQNLTNSPDDESFGVWSPNGRKILYLKRIPATNSFQIWVMNADGSNQMLISEATEQNFQYRWSPNGQQVLFVRRAGGIDQVWKMNADGTDKINLSNSSTNDHIASWSPNGNKIVFGRCDTNFICDVFTMNADGTNKINLTPTNPNDDDVALWTPDGTKIVFSSNDGNVSTSNIAIMNADGTNKQILIDVGESQFYSPNAISPNGFAVAMQTGTVTGGITAREIASVNIDGTNLINLTNNSVLDQFNAWSPDSSKIAFHRRIGTSNKIFIMSADGSNEVQISNNSDSENVSDWRKPVAPVKTPFDFDGDGKSDISVFRPSNGVWYLNQSQNGFTGITFGLGTDLIAPADFDGDGKSDLAVFRPSNGAWYYTRSSDGAFVGTIFGQNGDLPRPGDFDGDGKADLAVFRPANGTWYLQQSTAGFAAVGFGSNGDKPLLADFDGDGKNDIAVFRPANATFYWLDSSTGAFKAANFGLSTDIPTMGDYDGDGKTDIAVFRPSNGAWYRTNSSDGSFFATIFGLNGDIPTAADYDGDGKADIGVFRPSNGSWYYQQSSNGGFFGQGFGISTDKPIPSAFQ